MAPGDTTHADEPHTPSAQPKQEFARRVIEPEGAATPDSGTPDSGNMNSCRICSQSQGPAERPKQPLGGGAAMDAGPAPPWRGGGGGGGQGQRGQSKTPCWYASSQPVISPLRSSNHHIRGVTAAVQSCVSSSEISLPPHSLLSGRACIQAHTCSNVLHLDFLSRFPLSLVIHAFLALTSGYHCIVCLCRHNAFFARKGPSESCRVSDRITHGLPCSPRSPPLFHIHRSCYHHATISITIIHSSVGQHLQSQHMLKLNCALSPYTLTTGTLTHRLHRLHSSPRPFQGTGRMVTAATATRAHSVMYVWPYPLYRRIFD